jgi:hypothetical protein
VVAVTHSLLGALIFVGCAESKPEHSPQLHQTQRANHNSCLWKGTSSARISCTRSKRILGLVVPFETVCEMHVTYLLQTLSLLNAEHTNSTVVG